MATGSQNMTTFNAKHIIGDSANVNWTGALLHSGTDGKTSVMDTWIFADDFGSASSTYGFLYRQSDDKFIFIGGSTNRFWNDLNTGDTYIAGKLGIRYNPETSGNTYKLYVNGSSYFSNTIHLPNGLQTGSRVSGTGSGVEISDNGGIEIYHTSTPFIDFHYQASTADYSVRLICNSATSLKCIGSFIATGDITADGGYLKSTAHSNTVTIGSQNANFTHIYNSANIPFIFNNTVESTSGDLGTTTYPWHNIYIGPSNGAGIYYKGSKAAYRMIRFIDNASDGNGNGISIGGGGLTLIGGGESADTLISNLNLTNGGTETLYVTSDNSIEFYPDQQSYSAAARIWMTAGILNIGVDGNTTRENSLNIYSGAGRLQLYSAASTTGNRGLWVPAHGSGSAKNIILIDTNNNATFNGNASTATRINGNLPAATSNVNRNIWVSSTGDADGIPNYISGFNMNPSTKVFTVPASTRISPSAGALYLGNSGNQNWVYVQDMCSQDGQKWKIHQSGAMEMIGRLWIQGGSEAGSNTNRLTTTSGMPGDMQYNASRRGTQIYSNGIAFADPYNGNSNSDAGWIRHQETTSNTGELEIAVGDDGDETVVVRQYNTSNGIKRTLTLLSKDGYALFPSYINIGGHEKNASSPTYVWGSNSSDSYLRSYQTSHLNVATATAATSYLGSRGTVSGSNHAEALKAYFDSYKASEPRNALVAHYSSASGNGSLCMGYFLSGYDSSPYGGFFVCHYNNPRYVGIINGTYTQHDIMTNQNYTSWTVTKTGSGASGTWGISISGNSATTSSLKDSAHSWSATEVYNYMTARVLKAGDTMTGQLYINYDQDVGLNQNGSLIIGTKNSTNIGIDSNEIMARNNGAASTLYINSEGGQIYSGGPITTTSWIQANGALWTGKSSTYYVALGGASGYGWIDFRTGNEVMKQNIVGYSDCIVISKLSYSPGSHSSSSRLIKEHIAPLNDVDARKLLQLRPISFKIKEQWAYGDTSRHIGLIAEEVLPILPDVVNIPENYSETKVLTKECRPMGISYEEIVPYLIKLAQMQQREIDALKLRVARLSNT